MDSVECLDAYVTDKPIDMEIDGEGMEYMDEDLTVLMLKEEETHWEPPAITELKNWAWEGATHPMEDSVKKIKTIEPITPTKNTVSIPIESVYASIIVPIESICDRIP